MPEWPGAPFTGEVFTDLVQFFLVPTVFMILIIYFALGSLFGGAHSKFRMLFGIAAYLFVITGGYFRTFALIAGPYFLFLIFGLGLVWFLLRQFRLVRGGGGGAPGAGGLLLQRREKVFESRAKRLREQIESVEKQIVGSRDPERIAELTKKLQDLREELKDEEMAAAERRAAA
jgi:hypothetical protein